MAPAEPVGSGRPTIDPSAFVADGATVVGAVTLGEEASVWYGAVLRGDVGWIRIGARTNVQDLACIHMTLGVSNVDVGEEATIGHGAIVHGATIGPGALIGMGAVLLDGVEVGSEAIVAAGAVVPPGTRVPPRTLALGTPAKVVRDLTEREWRRGREGAKRYVDLVRDHVAGRRG